LLILLNFKVVGKKKKISGKQIKIYQMLILNNYYFHEHIKSKALKRRNYIFILVFIGVSWIYTIYTSCGTLKNTADHHIFPQLVDTKDRQIEMQEHKTYSINGVHADNEFAGARLNNFEAINDSTFKATISPENFPINISAYFGMRLRADTKRNVTVELHYTKHEHRYVPKTSSDGMNWRALKASEYDTLQAPNICAVRLSLSPEPLFLCGQELMASPHIKKWAQNQSKHSDAKMSVVGKSRLGRDMLFLDIGQDEIKGKETIVIVSRQHPPEVTGYMAMEAFVEEILKNNPISNAFRSKYRVMVFPLMNPDGVDEGHWRHNAGGIDMNRDWSVYNQPENRLVADYIVSSTNKHKNKVIVGLDFHSTQNDVFYTLPDNRPSSVFPFKDLWLEGMEQSIVDYHANDESGDISAPITKFWFYLQFGAEGITYEVGDEVSREFIKEKAVTAAQEMMQLLVLR
jgi:hypothetical protein